MEGVEVDVPEVLYGSLGFIRYNVDGISSPWPSPVKISWPRKLVAPIRELNICSIASVDYVTYRWS